MNEEFVPSIGFILTLSAFYTEWQAPPAGREKHFNSYMSLDCLAAAWQINWITVFLFLIYRGNNFNTIDKWNQILCNLGVSKLSVFTSLSLNLHLKCLYSIQGWLCLQNFVLVTFDSDFWGTGLKYPPVIKRQFVVSCSKLTYCMFSFYSQTLSFISIGWVCGVCLHGCL